MKVHKWTKKQVKTAKKPDYTKLYVTRPALFKEIGNVHGKEVLEIGCGNGYWLRILAKKGAKCTGFDVAKNQIEIAKNSPFADKINYFIADATKKTKLKKKFDIIFIEHVLLEIPNLIKIKSLFRETYRLMKNGGLFIVSDLHPFAPQSEYSRLHIEKGYHYFKSGARVKIFSKKPDGKFITYVDIHWTLQNVINAITDSGFVITKIIEPNPSKKLAKKYPALKDRYNKPLTIMIKSKKL